MIDHIGIDVANYKRSRSFYKRALPAIGWELVEEVAGWMAFGPPRQPVFWLRQGEPATQPMHIAFAAPDRAAVDAFYAAAIAAGAADNGPPGLREIYHPNYYGAFVLDPDGHNIEAVCHRRVSA